MVAADLMRASAAVAIPLVKMSNRSWRRWLGDGAKPGIWCKLNLSRERAGTLSLSYLTLRISFSIWNGVKTSRPSTFTDPIHNEKMRNSRSLALLSPRAGKKHSPLLRTVFLSVESNIEHAPPCNLAQLYYVIY